MPPRYAPLAPLLLALLALRCGGGEGALLVATTTSVQDSGLLEVLLPVFEAETGIRVKVVAVGSGAAVAMARRGDVDAVLVHDPELEAAAVAAGDLVEGVLVMTNDFLLVGPPEDPAGVRGAGDAVAAFRRLAESGAPFVSRGDGSGTHAKELRSWRLAGVDPARLGGRVEAGQGMAATLTIASERRAYALTDRATFLVLRGRLGLVPLVEGGRELVNPYHAYVVSPERHPRANAEAARRWVAFLVSPVAQQLIADFGRDRYGEALFLPARPRAEEVAPR